MIDLVEKHPSSIEIETLCRQYVAETALGDPVILDAAKMHRVFNLFKTCGK